MSAFGTKKRYGDEGVQLTFPANFQKAYNLGYSYFPSGEYHHPDILIGRDFQSEYHAEKKRYADRNVMNFLHNNKTAERLLMTGHQNYHLPKPYLTQRKFANPSYGVVGFPSSRRDDKEAPFQTIETGMRGGVLSSYEGQQYYRNKLEERSEQLSRMNTLATGTPVPIESVSRLYDNKKIGSSAKVNFFIALNFLVDTLIEGQLNRFSFEDLKTFIIYLLRVGPTASMDELNAIIRGLDGVLYVLRDALSENPVTSAGFNRRPEGGREDYNDNQLRNFGVLLQSYLERAKQYVVDMVRAVYFTPRERENASNTSIRTLEFDKLVAIPSVLQGAREVARRDVRARQAREDFDGEDGEDGDDDDGGGDGRFNDGARTREDEENNQPRQPLAGVGFDENQERFGRRNGEVVYGNAQFFNDAREPTMYAPLAFSGYDPDAERVELDPASLVRMANDTIETLRSELAGDNQFASLADVITENYGADPSLFAREVIRRMEATSATKAQVARGLEGIDDDEIRGLFSEYIAENTGPIDPQRNVSGLVGVRSNVFAPLPSAPPMANVPPMRRQEEAPLEAPIRNEGRDFPSRREVEEILNEMGMPLIRADFQRNFRTTASIIPIANALPRKYGGPYKPRADSHPKNVKEELVKRIQKFIDPTY